MNPMFDSESSERMFTHSNIEYQNLAGDEEKSKKDFFGRSSSSRSFK